MALARAYDSSRGTVTVTSEAVYKDRLHRWSDIQEYLPFLHETAKTYRNVRVLELGSRKGNSTLAFLAAADAVNGHVWSGDIDQVDLDPEGMRPWRGNPRWTFICGDDMDPDIQAQYPPEVDVFFLDTSHEYEHTLAELDAFMPRVAKGGVALFHDTHLIGWPGYESPVKGVPPVRAALDDYCRETAMTWEEIPGTYGLGVIRI